MAVGKSEFEGIESYSSDSIPPLGKSTIQTDEIQVITIEKTLPRDSPYQARLPGMGEQGEGCGEPSAHYCTSCGQSFWALSTCRQRECPDCYELWASIEARRASKRIWIARREAFRHGILARVLHCVVSFPVDDLTLNEARAKARRIARAKGISGEMTIFHPFRQDDDNEWWMDGTIHFHLIGLALGNVHPAVQGEDFVWKVIKDARRGDYRGFQKLRHLKSCIAYQLSHCGIVDAHHSVTWSGSLSYNQLKQSIVDGFPDAPEKGRKCPKCGSRETEPCDQYDIVPIFGARSWENQSQFQLLTVHPYPDEPPPPRRVVSISWRASPQ